MSFVYSYLYLLRIPIIISVKPQTELGVQSWQGVLGRACQRLCSRGLVMQWWSEVPSAVLGLLGHWWHAGIWWLDQWSRIKCCCLPWGGVGFETAGSVDFEVVVCLDLFSCPVEFGAKESSCAPSVSVGAAGVIKVGRGVAPEGWGVCEWVEIDMLMGVEGCPIHTRCLKFSHLMSWASWWRCVGVVVQ
jgi:hypothetical protein